MFAKILLTLICVTLFGACSVLRPDIPKESPTQYVSWGVDEYELFGLSKEELDAKYKESMRFTPNYSKAVMSDAKNECKTFVGPTFRLTYNADGKVVAVQRCFEACGKDFVGPQLNSKKEALQFAIQGLANTKNAKDQEKLKSAKAELAKLK